MEALVGGKVQQVICCVVMLSSCFFSMLAWMTAVTNPLSSADLQHQYASTYLSIYTYTYSLKSSRVGTIRTTASVTFIAIRSFCDHGDLKCVLPNECPVVSGILPTGSQRSSITTNRVQLYDFMLMGGFGTGIVSTIRYRITEGGLEGQAQRESCYCIRYDCDQRLYTLCSHRA